MSTLSASKSVNQVSVLHFFFFFLKQISQSCPNPETYVANPRPEIPHLCRFETLGPAEGGDKLRPREENHIRQRDFLDLIKVLTLMSIVSDLPNRLTKSFPQITPCFQKNTRK